MAVLVPEALPWSAGRTVDIRALEAGAKYRPIPMPLMISGASWVAYETSALRIRANHARPRACRASPAATTGRLPIRSERIPAIGATIIGMPVQGSMRSPASVGEYPETPWKNWLSRKIEPNMPRNMSR